jgi:rhodanese-related sulfurtransferase
MSGVQVVSGAGQGLEGQLLVLHKDLDSGASASGYWQQKTVGTKGRRGPCYRCLFPKAPRPEDVTDCEDGGVLGGVTGLVGTMQAVEVIKLLVGMSDEEEPPHMILVTPFDYPPFRTVKLRPQRITSCRACGDSSSMKEEDRQAMLKPDLSGEDYTAFCGLDRPEKEVGDLEQVDVTQLSEAMKESALVIDVRPQVEYEIASLSPTTNIPFRSLQCELEQTRSMITKLAQQQKGNGQCPVYLVCRKGNDSLLAQRALSQVDAATSSQLHFVNVRGGLQAWSEKVDESFPVY